MACLSSRESEERGLSHSDFCLISQVALATLDFKDDSAPTL
jgi:hypothetical protein